MVEVVQIVFLLNLVGTTRSRDMIQMVDMNQKKALGSQRMASLCSQKGPHWDALAYTSDTLPDDLESSLASLNP